MYEIFTDVTQKMRHDLAVGKVAAPQKGVFVHDFLSFCRQALLMAILHHVGCRIPEELPTSTGDRRIFSINSTTEDLDFETQTSPDLA